MPAIYTEDCISFSPVFEDISEQKLVEAEDTLAFRSHEGAAGMNIGEMFEKMDQPVNLLYLRSRRVHQAFEFSKMAFLPPPHTIATLQDLYHHNAKCSMSERKRFDEIPELHQDCEYVLDILRFCDDIFLRHPVTGEVTMHQFPYGDMPRFRLRTAHPSLASVAADRHLAGWPSGYSVGHPLDILGQTREAIEWPPLDLVCPPTKTTARRTRSPSHQQKVSPEVVLLPPPVKRARKTAMTMNRRQPATSSPISSPDLRLSRKRKTCADTDTPVPSPTKRVRTQPAEARTIAANGCSRIAGACRATRSVRAAKTKAVSRMAKVA
ncbi:hypothetical protein CYLTODRAFT_492925 [Cylindrobasidium torrendii FP15055 ss-10]|uniref:Uncharacterized protein n=1 Tax=Cylindrobasidium torrendii FP15055 ss-10 TaxID=1314674 RepID=A0A0D7B3D0_9AGAR|nr:hypothetical protein CYLTODRAFT_492925 [Cylindrobasidium torrendii FP15055 ss-10]